MISLQGSCVAARKSVPLPVLRSALHPRDQSISPPCPVFHLLCTIRKSWRADGCQHCHHRLPVIAHHARVQSSKFYSPNLPMFWTCPVRRGSRAWQHGTFCSQHRASTNAIFGIARHTGLHSVFLCRLPTSSGAGSQLSRLLRPTLYLRPSTQTCCVGSSLLWSAFLLLSSPTSSRYPSFLLPLVQAVHTLSSTASAFFCLSTSALFRTMFAVKCAWTLPTYHAGQNYYRNNSKNNSFRFIFISHHFLLIP